MILVHDLLEATVAQRRRARHIAVSLLPFRQVLLATKYGTVTVSRAEVSANWPDKGKVTNLLLAKLGEAESLVRTRGRKAA